MIISDHKRIIETPENDNLDNAYIGWCDTTGSFICYVETKILEGLEVIEEIPVVSNEQWDMD